MNIESFFVVFSKRSMTKAYEFLKIHIFEGLKIINLKPEAFYKKCI